jgi:hypothetical protein
LARTLSSPMRPRYPSLSMRRARSWKFSRRNSMVSASPPAWPQAISPWR